MSQAALKQIGTTSKMGQILEDYLFKAIISTEHWKFWP